MIISAGDANYRWGEGVAYATRGVQVESDGQKLRVRADSIVAWLDEGGGGTFSEFYAEGHIILEIGDPAVGYDVLEADRIYVDVRTFRGRASGVRVNLRNLKQIAEEDETPDWGRGVDRLSPGDVGNVKEVFLTAAEVELEGVFRYRAEQAQVTTCDYGEPHYALRAGEVEVGEDFAIHIRNATARAFGVPILYWPRLYWDLDWNPYVPRLRFGRSSEFGNFVESEWTLYSGEHARLTGVVDYYEKRGTGYGGNLHYRARQMRGRVTGYYLEDRGEDELPIPGVLETPPAEEMERHRWRGRWFHWSRLPHDWDIFAEYAEESDRNLLTEYFEREARESKPRETFLYLRKNRELWGMSFLYKLRTNKFQTEVEALPQADLDVNKVPLFDVPGVGRPVYYSQETEVGNFRHRPDQVQTRRGIDRNLDGLFNDDLDGDLLPDPLPAPRAGYDFDGDGIPEFYAPIRSWRFDTHHELRMPVPIGPFTATPFAGGRYTFYEKTLVSDDSHDRSLAEAGLRLDTQAHRAFPGVESRVFQLSGLRHVVNPSVQYFLRYLNTAGPQGLIPFDESDLLDETEGITLALRNRLQTRRKLPGDAPDGTPATIDFFDFEVRSTYFPSRRSRRLRGDWSRIEFDLRLALFHWLTLLGDADLDSVDYNAERWSVSAITSLPEVYTVGVSFRKVNPLFLIPGEENPRHFVTVGATVHFTEKWAAEANWQYDLNGGQPVDQLYSIKRYLHKWVLRVNFGYNRGRDDVFVTVNFNLTALDPDRPVSIGRKQDFLGFGGGL